MERGGVAKRRAPRIQGGWASNGPPSGQGRGRGRGRGRGLRAEAPPFIPQGSHPDVLHQDYGAQSGVPPVDVAFEEPAQPAQHFTGQPQNMMFAGTLNFVQPEEPIKQDVKPIVIENSCKKVMSTEPSGNSEIQLITDFLDKAYAEEAFNLLLREVNWTQQINESRDGRKYQEPRQVCWYGEHPYAYSRVRMDANTQWPPTLLKIKEKIEKETSLTFNSVLANLYRNEKDGVAWHSDDEYGLRKHPKIASLSLGETRMFELRKKPDKGIDPWNYDYTYSEKYNIPLTSGALLLMTGCTQDDWQHRVPREYHDKNTRINLTFRNIYSDGK